MTKPIEIFFSYAHEDEELMNEVRKHLVLYERLERIEKWHDRQIPPGSAWEGEIDFRLKRAKIILFFVSSDFFESDYIYDVEMSEALLRHNSGQAKVIPIILRPCDWKDAPFGHIQALPTDGKPVTEWDNFDAACKDIAQGIMRVVSEFSDKNNS